MKRIFLIGLMFVFLMSATGCFTATGALLGAGAGLAAGGKTGAIVGGLIGAGAGTLVDNLIYYKNGVPVVPAPSGYSGYNPGAEAAYNRGRADYERQRQYELEQRAYNRGRSGW